jgi:hypothetical protein
MNPMRVNGKRARPGITSAPIINRKEAIVEITTKRRVNISTPFCNSTRKAGFVSFVVILNFGTIKSLL